MKNKLLIITIIYSIITSVTFADQLKFETSEIEIVDNGNIVNASNGKVLSIENKIEIEAKKFEYVKNLNSLTAYNGVAYFKSDNLEIKFDEINLNELSLIITAKNNVEILDVKKKLSIKTENIIYNKKKNILESKYPSILKDNSNNTLSSKNFWFDINEGIVKLKNANLKDFDNNNFDIETAFLDIKTNKLIGKDISINLNNESFNKDNEPRIKGKNITYENGLTEITKGVFTTCKKTDKCPPWQLSAEKIKHDSNKKTINYKNALLKVYDIPVMYFPKFFHPDPTVKRKSGFLIPTLKNSPSSNSYLSIPYFSVISQNKDMTFSPRLYSNNKLLLQTEYRQKNKNSSHIADVSIFNESDENSKTHLFYNYNKLINFANFDEGNLDLKIERSSNDTYLRKNKLSSPLIKSLNVLENTLGISLFSDTLSINSEVKVYENLDKINNDRYEFVLPKVDIEKKIKNKTNLDGDLTFKSNNFIRSYATNILEKVNINNLIFNSQPKITNKGFYNNYEFMIKNINSDSKNSSNFEEDEDFYLSSLFQFNSSFPLIKENDNLLNIIKPKMALKLSPNYTKDISKDDGKRLDVNNIYNFDRLSADDALEGGASLTIGNDFTIFDKTKSKEVFGVKLANNLRLEENTDLPKNNQIGAKNSNFFGEILFNPNEIITAKYNVSTKNNLTDINYESLSTEISLNNFVTTFDYLNENNSSDKNSYLTNTTTYNLNKSNKIEFSTRENKSSNLTEYYNLIYEYKNDCLAASIEYNKDYYDDRDIKPEENIFLKLTIIPFGETSSPNLKN